MGQPLGGHGVGTGHHVIAPQHRPGEQTGQQRVGQTVPVGQLIDPGALGGRRAVEGQNALMGHRPQEALLHRPRLSGPLGLQLPAQNAPGPLGQLRLHLLRHQGVPHVLPNLSGRPQTAVGPLVVFLVAPHAALELLPYFLEPLPVIANAQVDVLLHHAGILGLYDVGSRPVHQGRLQPGQHHPVQGIRVPGTQDVLHRLPHLGGLGRHLAHEGGLAAARAALDDVNGAGRLRGQQLVVQRIKALRYIKISINIFIAKTCA